MEQDVGIGKYVLIFGLVNLGLLVGLDILFFLLDVESNSGATIGALMGAGVAAVSRFIQDNKRIPNPSEKTKLVWLSYLASWIVSLILVGVFVVLSGEGGELMEIVKSINVVILIVVIVFLSVFYVGALYLTYGYVARKQFEGLQKKGKI